MKRHLVGVVVTFLFTIPVAVHATPAPLTLTTTNAGYVAGAFTDSASLTGGNTPIGELTFHLYDPSNSLISTAFAPVAGDTNATVNIQLTALVSGTYTWDVSYTSSDSNNVNVAASPETFQVGTPTSTPEPSSLLLLGTGALGLFGPIRRKLLPHRK